MNKFIFCLITVLAIVFISCKKDAPNYRPLSSLKVVNTLTGGAVVKVNNNGTTVSNNAVADFSLPIGNPDIYVYPVADSANPYYTSNKGVAVSEGDIFTCFIGGNVANKTALLVKENLPVHTDSTAGVRFINLSPGSPVVKVTLSTSTGTSEFGDIVYGQPTEFKSYAAASINSTYTFQVRNAANNTIIASITMSGTTLASFVPRFRNVTLVLRGVVGGSPAAGITRVNHYL